MNSDEEQTVPQKGCSRFHRLERILFQESEISRRIAEMGAEIESDYRDEKLTVVTIMQGGAVFMADLIRQIHLPLKVDSISVTSYYGATTSSGAVTFHQNRLPDIDGRHVLIVDDILDTGRTLGAIRKRLAAECSALSLKVAVLLEKRVERVEMMDADYRGFEVENEFVVGYGLDYQGEYRNLPVIGVLKSEFVRPS